MPNDATDEEKGKKNTSYLKVTPRSYQRSNHPASKTVTSMHKLSFSTAAFDQSQVSFSVRDKEWVAIQENNPVYRLLLVYIAANKIDLPAQSQSFEADILPAKHKAKKKTLISSSICGNRVELKIGTGEFSFRSNGGEVLYALHQQVGEPVGTGCGARILSNLILFSDRTAESIGEFISWVVEVSEQTEEGSFSCYSWVIRNSYWRMEAKIRSRPMRSVVLPAETKSLLIQDVQKFLSSRTKDFYNRNGIPYRRSYLFYGVPGTGKTSMVQALAGYFNRCVCYLMPTHPDMTDDSLKDAMNRLPDDAIIVFEDIDALFTKKRENKVSKSSLTFSGLLNALDGIGNPNGQICILTTNLRDELDHALIRNGRVDLHVEFSYATAEQMALMFTNFYPESNEEQAQLFAQAVTTRLKEENMKVTTSGLQHYFVSQMDCSAEEAISNIESVVRSIRRNSVEKVLDNSASGAEDERKDGGSESTPSAVH